MVGRDRPSRARRAMPAARAIALRDGRRARVLGEPAGAVAQPKPRRPAAHPRRRDRAAAARLHRADPASVAGLAQQNVQVVLINERVVQRLRDGRPAHLRERRRAATTPRRRTRSSACWRTRPATSPAGICRACASSSRTRRPPRSSRMLLGVGAIVGGASRRRRQHAAQIAAGRDPGAAGDDPPLAALLSARAGRSGRPRGGEVPQRHRPVGQGHADDLQALRRRHAVHLVARRSLSAVASDAARARAQRSKTWSRPARTGTRTIRPNCSCATT